MSCTNVYRRNMDQAHRRCYRLGRRGLFLMLAVLLSNPLAAELGDPMRPADYDSPVPGDGTPRGVDVDRWKLTSIVISPQRRVAVINGRPVVQGDSLGDVVVQEIRPVEVLLRRDGREIVLSLYNRSVKVPVGE